MKYVIFNGNEVGATYRTKYVAMRVARKISESLTIGEVTDDGRILRMWNTNNEPFRFESHGGDYGTWRAPS